jgi:DNA gyrase/topoisomerase IV subunit B
MVGKDAVISDNKTKEKRGTLVRFTPDYEEVFKDVSAFNMVEIEARLSDAANLLPKTKITLEFGGASKDFKCAGVAGILGVTGAYSADFDIEVEVGGDKKTAGVSIAWCWGSEGRAVSLVNLSRTSDGGQHASGWESAISDFLLERCKNKCSSKEILDTLQYAVHVSHPNPQFSSQTKEKLINKGLGKAISEAAVPQLKSWARRNTAAVDALLQSAIAAYEARQAQKDLKAALKDLKTTRRNSRGILPDKLFEADCKPYMRELYLVEGDSAAGSAVKGRDAGHQEILPLKGKILNVFKASEAEAIANDEIAAIVASVGGGFGARFNMADVRIGKVIILSDSDHDGHHISSLIVGLFAKYMPGLLEKGMIYTVDAPLYKASLPGTRTRWFGHTMDDIKAKAGKQFSKCDVTRLKGHGEANPDEVAEYAMGSTRKLIQLSWKAADVEEIVRVMGDDIAGRKELLGI